MQSPVQHASRQPVGGTASPVSGYSSVRLPGRVISPGTSGNQVLHRDVSAPLPAGLLQRGQSDVIRSTRTNVVITGAGSGMLPVRHAPQLSYPGTPARTTVVPAGIATEGGQRKTSPAVIQAWQPMPLSSQGSYVGISQAPVRAPAVRQAISRFLLQILYAQDLETPFHVTT
ncbi:unnamed protein product [Polarella glacialis]|uniref:Uncharacterized protein n=1 Tax=Polarella glacialis TaxID=89957 RepID=A0A813FSD8_POLGL|nr:unnamed protein product [Polarella glacialis]